MPSVDTTKVIGIASQEHEHNNRRVVGIGCDRKACMADKETGFVAKAWQTKRQDL